MPEIVDYDLPEAGVFHNCCIVSIDKRFPKHAHKVMNAIWGAGLLSLSKLVVVVDSDCDVHDYAEVAWRAFGNVDYAHDVVHMTGPVDHLDHASYEQFYGGKLGIDATAKWETEGYRRAGGWPERVRAGPGRPWTWSTAAGPSTACNSWRYLNLGLDLINFDEVEHRL